MSVTVNKQLSPAKELFLSIALVAQEISSETVRKMKEDYSDSVIRNSVIKSLRKKAGQPWLSAVEKINEAAVL